MTALDQTVPPIASTTLANPSFSRTSNPPLNRSSLKSTSTYSYPRSRHHRNLYATWSRWWIMNHNIMILDQSYNATIHIMFTITITAASTSRFDYDSLKTLHWHWHGHCHNNDDDHSFTVPYHNSNQYHHDRWFEIGPAWCCCTIDSRYLSHSHSFLFSFSFYCDCALIAFSHLPPRLHSYSLSYYLYIPAYPHLHPASIDVDVDFAALCSVMAVFLSRLNSIRLLLWLLLYFSIEYSDVDVCVWWLYYCYFHFFLASTFHNNM